MGRGNVRDLLAFDPGAVTGWAHFVDGVLMVAGAFRQGKGPAHVFEVVPGHREGLAVVIEKPVIYREESKGDPNGLITLAIRAGEIGGLFRGSAKVEYIRPSTWKGSTPKPINHARTMAKLKDLEKDRLPKLAKSNAHNMLDAIGLGLWWLEKERLR